MKNYIIPLLLVFASVSVVAQDVKDKKDGLKRIDQGLSKNISIHINDAVLESLTELESLRDLQDLDMNMDFNFNFDFDHDFDFDMDINLPDIDIDIPDMDFEMEFDEMDVDIDVDLSELRNSLKEMQKELKKIKEKKTDN